MHPQEYRRLAALEGTHWWYRSLHALVLDTIVRSAALLPPRPRILDAGCGTGLMARRLAGVGEVVAVDLSEHAAAFWRGHEEGSLRFVRGSVAALPFRDEAFDLVVSLDVLYHRAIPDDAAAARELARVLRPGGLLLLNLPAYNSLRSAHDRAIHTARRYTRGRVVALLDAAGLTPLRVAHWNTALFPLAVASRLLGRLRRVPEGEASDLHPVSPVVNETLRRIVACELALQPYWRPPFGLSVVALAQKEPGSHPRAPQSLD